MKQDDLDFRTVVFLYIFFTYYLQRVLFRHHCICLLPLHTQQTPEIPEITIPSSLIPPKRVFHITTKGSHADGQNEEVVKSMMLSR
jgi:hypothetical protein